MLVASGAVAVSAPNRHTLALLDERGAAHPALWRPPCARDEQRLALDVDGAQREWFVDVLDMLIAAESGLGAGDPSPPFAAVSLDRAFGGNDAPNHRGADGGEGSRFSNGLPQRPERLLRRGVPRGRGDAAVLLSPPRQRPGAGLRPVRPRPDGRRLRHEGP